MNRQRAIDVVSNICLSLGWFGWTIAHALSAGTRQRRVAWVALMIVVPGIVYLLYRYFRRPAVGPISDWYRVSFDTTNVYLVLVPPAKRSSRTIPWVAIDSARFVEKDFMSSDEVWIMSGDNRKVMAKVPTEAAGGPEFVGELASRNLLTGLAQQETG